MKTIKDIEYLEGVKVMGRVDFNVPLKNGVVADSFRIDSILPTIKFLQQKGAKVILISHLETNDGQNASLKPVANYLNGLGQEVIFVKDFRDANGIIEQMSNGQCLLMENLRTYEGEKKNDINFAKQLASLADIYVNEAFSVSHRAHASIVGIPKLLPSYAGLQFEKEVENLSQAFNPNHPFLFILGGAKFETKIPLLEKFLAIADEIFVGGALANDFFKALGYEMGQSLVSETDLDLSLFLNNPKICLPKDIINQNGEVRPSDQLDSADIIVDAGPQTMEMLKEKISQSKFILWNGPLGKYEKGFEKTTLELITTIAEATKNGAQSMIGGGDTVAVISKLGISNQITFISTGGGAMLDFLANGTLPGIDALNSTQ